MASQAIAEGVTTVTPPGGGAAGTVATPEIIINYMRPCTGGSNTHVLYCLGVDENNTAWAGTAALAFSIQARITEDGPWTTLSSSTVPDTSTGVIGTATVFPRMRIRLTYAEGETYDPITVWMRVVP